VKALVLFFGALVVWGAVTGKTGETGGPPTAATEIPTSGGHGALFGALVVVGLLVLVAKAGGGGSKHAHSTTTVARGMRGRHITVRTEPSRHADPQKRIKIAAEHEAGHKAVAKARGWKVRGVEVYPDGSGITRLYVPDRKYNPRDDIAVSLGGWKGSGTKAGCGSDFGHANAAYGAMSPDEREAGWREGVRRCNSALFWRAGERRRDAQRLEREGTL
jgi:hypothetical protein